MKRGGRVCVLTIAGSDSGGGAGVQADGRTIRALGGFALNAITAVTAQNTRGVAAWEAVSPALIAAQIEAVAGDFPVAAAKTGLLPGPAAIAAVAKVMARHRDIALVVDPVIGSTSGTRFLSAQGIRTLRLVLFPRAALVTPNWPEAEALTGRAVRTRAEVEVAAKALLEGGCRAVLIKGGHAPGKVCPDYLATAGGAGRWLESRRIPTRNTHGTGCVLSAAIATGLAQGKTVETAVVQARAFLHRSLRAGRRGKWGGRGPALS
jgi:hydroxymethylpyrimidine/phosphomethylpyrimidine kinase